MKLEVTYENFKALDSGSFDVKGNIIIVQGQNKAGKSSLINGILENLNAKSISKEPQTRESKAKKGYKIVTVLDKEGKEITVYHKFSKGNPKGEFYAETTNGVKITQVKKIRELIGDIAPYTVEDFFQKSKYTEGRRILIKDVFKKLLKEEEIERLNKIEADINNKNGILYLDRREKNTILKSSKINLDEKNEKITEYLDNLNVQTEEDSLKELKELEKQKINPESIAKATKQVEKLNQWLNALNTIEASVDKFPEKFKTGFEDKIFKFKAGNEGIKELFNSVIESAKKKLNSTVDEKRKNELVSLKQIIEARDEIETNVKNLQKKIDKINEIMDDAIEERKNILTNANLPNGLIIESESDFSYNGFEFNENEISESEAWLVILEIMMQIYSGKLIFAGNASIYDKNSKSKILELAQKHNKQVMLEQVHEDMEEVSMVAYVNEETSEKQNKKQNRQENPKDDKTPTEEKKSVKQTENASKNEMEENGYDGEEDKMNPNVDTSKDPFDTEEINQEKSESNDNDESDPFDDGINLFGSADFDD